MVKSSWSARRSFLGFRVVAGFVLAWTTVCRQRTSEAFTLPPRRHRSSSLVFCSNKRTQHVLLGTSSHWCPSRRMRTTTLALGMAKRDQAETKEDARAAASCAATSIPSNLPSLTQVLSASKQGGSTTASTPSSSQSCNDARAPAKNGKRQQSRHQKTSTKTTRTTTSDSADSSSSTAKTSSSRRRPSSSSSSLETTTATATRGPWLASYATSRQTQQRIQEMGGERTQRWTPLRRAAAVLQTLLDTPAEQCNAANLVCALTLSAKLRGESSSSSSSWHHSPQNRQATAEQELIRLRRLLWQVLRVLQQVNAAKQLSARQICNAAWAIAKHFDRDALLLPGANHKQTALSSNRHFGTAETWTLTADDVENGKGSGQDVPSQIMVNQLVDELALNLAGKLQDDPWIAKEGELCMACWAYGVLRERRRPAGWKVTPQVGAVRSLRPPETKTPKKQKQQKQQQKQRKSRQDAMDIRFEQWQGPLHNSQGEECSDLDPPGPTDELLDQISLALCQPVAQIQKHTAKNNVNTNTTEPTAAAATIRLQACRWSELAHVAWAHASHGWSCSEAAEGVLLALASEAAQRLHNPVPDQRPLSRDMAQLVWSLGILQADNFHLTAGLMELLKGVAAYTQFQNPAVKRPFADWSCPDIVQVPLALAHARVDNQEMLRELYSEAKGRVAQLSSSSKSAASRRSRNLHAWEISILLWAQARLHLTGAQGVIFEEFPTVAINYLLAAAEQEGGWKAIGIGGQEQANLIWSMTVLEKFQTSQETRLLQELFLASQEDCREAGIIQLEHAHQLWQALYLLEEESPLALEGIQSWFRDTLEAKWLQEKTRPKVSSARHRALSKVLADMGVAHFNEHDEDIDVAIVLKRAATWTHETNRMSLDSGVRVAVEFDGPNHFTRILDGSSRVAPRPLGHSILKYRLLKKQGWTVVRVPYYEFDRIPFWASMERQRYVQRLLKTHSDLRFSTVDVSEYKPPVANRKSRYQ